MMGSVINYSTIASTFLVSRRGPPRRDGQGDRPGPGHQREHPPHHYHHRVRGGILLAGPQHRAGDLLRAQTQEEATRRR